MAMTRVKIVKVYISHMMYEYEFAVSGMEDMPEEEIIKMADNNEFKYCIAYPVEEKSSKLIHEFLTEVKEHEDSGGSALNF